ncbi:hypothetical protein, partial [Ruminiclostridium hungatei]|uniref:hypothetical protein n=1 Tax=Ruminiclostridium hungatei TaxID=48256 RepID=UPI00105550CC
MDTDLKNFRYVSLLVDKDKNIVIFPISKSNKLLDDGVSYAYYEAYEPIELTYPYESKDLALKIGEGIEAWNEYTPYESKKTFEEKYYGIKGFKNASLGKKYITLGWNDIESKYISLGLPLKKGYGYMGIESIKLKEDADYLDYANAVIDLINL